MNAFDDGKIWHRNKETPEMDNNTLAIFPCVHVQKLFSPKLLINK